MSQRDHVNFAVLTVLALSLGCDAITPVSPDDNANRPPREQLTPDAEQGEQIAESKWPGELKAGIALPQSLPDGTQIGFSVDYRFRSYTPDPDAQYVWEIRMGDGSIKRLSVQIAGKKGNLNQFLPVRPEAGPFSSRISVVNGQEGELTPLTEWISMQ